MKDDGGKDNGGKDNGKAKGTKPGDGKAKEAKSGDGTAKETKSGESGAKEGTSGDGRTGEGSGGGAEGPDRGARPAYARPPWQPDPGGTGVRFDAATDHRTLTATGPDGRTRVYDLYRPEADGNGFFAAVAHVVGGRYRDPALLAAAVVRSEEMPKDAPLDPDAVFRTEELDRRIGGTDYGRNPARERLDLAAVEADGGRLPEAVRAVLNPVQRAALVRLHVQRARRWDADTAALAASATARHLGVDLVVVDEDGTEHRHPGRTSRNTGPVPEVTIYRQGDSFLPAVPRTTATSSVTDTARATAPHTGGPSLRPAPSGREPGSLLPSDGTGTGPSLAPPAPPAPTAPPAPPLGAAAERSLAAAPAAPSGGKPVPPVVPGAARGTSAPAAEDARGAPVAAPLVPPTGPETAPPPPVRTASVSPAVGPRVTVGGHAFVRRAVAADGDCLLHAVRHGLRTQAPGLPAGRMDVAGLRRYLAHWYTHADAAAELRAAHAAQDPLDLLIRDQFPDRASLLALLGRTRPPELTPAQRERVDERVSDARMRAALIALAAEPGDRELLRDLPTGVARVLLPADPSALPRPTGTSNSARSPWHMPRPCGPRHCTCCGPAPGTRPPTPCGSGYAQSCRTACAKADFPTTAPSSWRCAWMTSSSALCPPPTCGSPPSTTRSPFWWPVRSASTSSSCGPGPGATRPGRWTPPPRGPPSTSTTTGSTTTSRWSRTERPYPSRPVPCGSVRCPRPPPGPMGPTAPGSRTWPADTEPARSTWRS